MSVHINSQTIEEMKEVLFPTTKGMGMAQHAVQFIIRQSENNAIPVCDIATLREFLMFLKERNYN